MWNRLLLRLALSRSQSYEHVGDLVLVYLGDVNLGSAVVLLHDAAQMVESSVEQLLLSHSWFLRSPELKSCTKLIALSIVTQLGA